MAVSVFEDFFLDLLPLREYNLALSREFGFRL
jgi:hypothetical protein